MSVPLREGYKQTEVGVIPEDWEVKSLHEFASIKTGPFGTVLKASEYSAGDGVPLISVGEIREGFLRITDDTPRVSETVTRRLPQYVLKAGDIVFGRKGGVERSSLIRLPQEGWFLGSDGISVRPSRDCHDEYLGLQFQSARVQGWLLQNAIGTTMPSLNQAILRNVAIPIPPTKAEQEAIAEALKDADALIDLLELLVTKKRQLKQGAMQDLLTGKKRLPGFCSEWEVKRLGDLSEMGSGGTPLSSVPEYYDGDVPWVAISDMTKGGKVIESTERNLSALGIINSAAQIFPVGTVLYAMYASLGECSIAGVSLCSSQAILGIRAKRNLSSEFLYYYLTSLKSLVKSLGQQGTQSNLNKGMVQDFCISLPSVGEQTAIATVLSDMDAEIVELDVQLAKARAIKQGMMNNLLTGKIRLI
jgi:type I restriction enzyme S subunit